MLGLGLLGTPASTCFLKRTELCREFGSPRSCPANGSPGLGGNELVPGRGAGGLYHSTGKNKRLTSAMP